MKNLLKTLFAPKLEVFTDAPCRIEPGMPVPLVCLIRRLKKQPFRLESIKVEIKQGNRTVRVASALKKPVDVHSAKWHKVIVIPLHDEMHGNFELNTVIKIRDNGKMRTILNDSFRGGNRRPITVFRAKDPLPRFSNFCFGDLHYHCYAEVISDVIGVPLLASAQIAKVLGLNFFAATNHSYVLESKTDAEGENSNSTWERFKEKVDSWNQKNDVIILPGEEVCCKNLRGRDVSLLIINYPEFIRGSLDSPVTPESHNYGLKELLTRVGTAAVTFAVHPVKKTSIYEKLFSGKGLWSKFDLTLSGLTGLQVYNGQGEYFLDQGLKNWIELLLKGQRKFIVAGSDAYVDFDGSSVSRYPFSLNRNQSLQEFGKARTGIFCTQPITREKIVSCLQLGKSVITNGPLMDFSVRNEIGERSLLGGELSGSLFTVKFRAVSTPEYGPVTHLKLYSGNISIGLEEQIYTVHFRKNKFSYQGEIHFEPRGKFGYLRGELFSGDTSLSRFCYTNPIWIRSAKD